MNTGRAIVQVSESTSDNAIVLYKGANHAIESNQIETVMESFTTRDVLVLQNEINLEASEYAISIAFSKGMKIVLNPAPCCPDILKCIDKIHTLIVNEIELEILCKSLQLERTDSFKETVSKIVHHYSSLSILIVTLGSKGGILFCKEKESNGFYLEFPALHSIHAVDTTGAGDTFVGYFIGTLIQRICPFPDIWTTLEIQNALIPSLEMAIIASGLCCEKVGAIPSIPDLSCVYEMKSSTLFTLL